MPVYTDNAQNRRLKRVGMSWGKVLVGTNKKGETKYKVPKDPEKLKKLQEETKKLKSMVSPKSKPAPKSDPVEEKEITQETLSKIFKKLNSLKKADLDKLLNFNQNVLEKYSTNFYGSNNWITLMGKVGEVRKRFMKVINERTHGATSKHLDKEAIKILNLLDNFKTSF